MSFNYSVKTWNTETPKEFPSGYEVIQLVQEVTSPTPLTDELVYEDACAEGEWKVTRGDYEDSLVGTYQVTTIS